MLRWVMRIKRIEKIRTEEIRARAGAANISEKIGELICLVHVDRKREEDNENMEVSGHRKIGSVIKKYVTERRRT